MTGWRTNLAESINAGALDQTLSQLYPDLMAARARLLVLTAAYENCFGEKPKALFSAPGRTEIGGNHTDHQHGRVLAASVNLDVIAAVAPCDEPVIRIQSEGYPVDVIDLTDLSPQPSEINQSASLIRGIAARMTELGHPVGGFCAYTTSTVLKGSGLSSSAAFEVLVGTIINHLFCDNAFSAVEIAQIGQYAENVFFGKPSGLMDQTASSVGSVISIDFADTAHPIVQQATLDLAAHGYALCIIDSGADHADLTDEYASIPADMKAVAQVLGCEVLRETSRQALLDSIVSVREKAGDRAVLRALHFFADNDRVPAQVQALAADDFPAFLRLVNESGRSSWLHLQNIVPTGATKHQEVALTLALCEQLLGGQGAFRVHGGGFAGTVQAFVPLTLLDHFRQGIEAVLGAGRCHVLDIRPRGGVRICE